METFILVAFFVVLVARIGRGLKGGLVAPPQGALQDKYEHLKYADDKLAAALVAGMYLGRRKERVPRDPMDRDFPDPGELVSFGEL